MNTLYLKADWLEPFLSEWTTDGSFTIGDRRVVTVPFMSVRDRCIGASSDSTAPTRLSFPTR